ncbi:proline hydroxylase [Hahella sp. CCB-MM4]|nr:proline hydroxylase [Hahella sp. CCB-MM4]
MPRTEATDLLTTVAEIDWQRVSTELDRQGYSVLENLLNSDLCRQLQELYAQEQLFRSRIVMQRYSFGLGEYQYFSYPLPSVVDQLRAGLYPKLVPIANRWNQTMGVESRYPEQLDDFLAECHNVGQCRPTPLLLKYQAGDYNCLHQDLYGSHVFPLQVAVQLSQPGRDFTGGEFVMTEQRPRMQSRPEVVSLNQGDAVVFAVHHRPVQGTRGVYKVNMRHGVSRLRSGNRYAMGIIFHDAS